MSFVLRDSRGDVETGFVLERPAAIRAAGPDNSNSPAYLVTAFFMFCMIMNYHEMMSNFTLWLVLVLALLCAAASLRKSAFCQQLQARAQAHAEVASGLSGRVELRLQMPPLIAFATRRRLQGLILQLDLFDSEFDEQEDSDTLSALEC